MKKSQIVSQVEVVDIANDGKAVARVEGKVIFISGALPGDVADIQITKSKKDWAEARTIQITKKSEHRVDAFCKHFGECGGCKWQDLNYETQLFYKHKTAVEAIRRIGKTEPKEIFHIIGCTEEKYYRNKLEFTFSNKKWWTKKELQTRNDAAESANALGFHVMFLFDKIVDVEHCWMQSSPSNEIRIAVKKFCDENNFSFFDLRAQVGLMRNLIIRTTSTGETMVIVCFHENDKEKILMLMNFLKEKFPEITSLNFVINEKRNDTIFDLPVINFSGNEIIVEQLEDFKFRISPKSFFQTNTLQALNLYRVVRDFAGLTGKELVYDLYTGTGSIALFVSKLAKKIIGIEQVEAAIEDAKLNAELNKIEHVEFFAGDMKDALSDKFINELGMPDVVITDPPRAGMHEDVVKKLFNMAPQKIVYVSCNPATQARDILLLTEKYEVVKMQPVDMFPHTHHIENVLLLERK